MFCKEFSQLVRTGSVEFRIACEDKYSTGIQLSKACWEPTLLTDDADEALQDADVVVLAADSNATIRKNEVSFQALKKSIERQASPYVRVVSYGLPVHEQGFKFVFPSWNVIPVPANDLAAVSTILGLLSGDSECARLEDDSDAFCLGPPGESCESLNTIEYGHAVEAGDGSGGRDDYFALELFPTLESEMEMTPGESSPSSIVRPPERVEEKLLSPASHLGEDGAYLEQYLSTSQPEQPAGYESASPPSDLPIHLVESVYSYPETGRSSKKRKRAIDCAKPEPHDSQKDAAEMDLLATQQPSLRSPPTPLSVMDDAPLSTANDAVEERRAKQRDRKKAQRATLRARAAAGDEKAKKKQAETKETQRRQVNRRRFRERLGQGKRGMEWLEPLFDACVELAPAYGQTVHALIALICEKLDELRFTRRFDDALLTKSREENMRRHTESPRNSPHSMLNVFDTLLRIAGGEANNVLDRIKQVHKVTEKYAKDMLSRPVI